jgi:hypothetical protein
MIDDGPNEIELEQSPQLQKEGIVNRFVFYRKTSSVQVLLNHQYESKSIVSSIDIHNWNNTHDVFEKTLKRRGVNKQHIPLLADVLDENYHVFISQDDNAGGEQQQEEPNESAAQIALGLAGEQCSSLFLDQFGTPYAAIEVDEHIETLPLKSSRFRNWLCKIFYSNSEGKILTSDNVTNVLSVLKARAEFDSHDTRALNSRVASRSEEPNTIFYDLTNKNWEYVKITSEGWRIEQSSKITPILFNRRASQQPQVYPAPASDDMYDTDDIFHIFMKLVNVKGEDNKLLLKCYIISLFYPDIPKPVLMLHGEQGSAKSTLQELIRVLVDPSSILTLTFPRDINELVQKLSHNYVAYFDNVSSIPDWISDQLCRAVTGSGFSKRELYTDDEDIIYNFKRCIGFNGINLGATKADLLDRGLIIELERIAKANQRRIEEIWAKIPDSIRLGIDVNTIAEMNQANPGLALKLEDMVEGTTPNTHWQGLASLCSGNGNGKLYKDLTNAGLSQEETSEMIYTYRDYLGGRIVDENGNSVRRLEYLKDHRIELNTILDAAGPQAFWNWLRYKILQVWPRRNYFPRAHMGFEDYMYTPTMDKFLEWAADLSKPIIKKDLEDAQDDLIGYEGLIDDVGKKKEEIEEGILNDTLLQDKRIEKLDKTLKIMNDGSFNK